jgi:hypothetical protein
MNFQSGDLAYPRIHTSEYIKPPMYMHKNWQSSSLNVHRITPLRFIYSLHDVGLTGHPYNGLV